MTSLSLYASMAAFALAASISPGPVNIVALGSGATHGLRPALRHVTGATVGFTVLLVLVGLGLHEALARFPVLTEAVRAGGVAFLLWLAWVLARDDGRLGAGEAGRGPTMWRGAVMQWFNPKAWLASVASMGAFVGDGDPRLLWEFAGLYFVICYLSIGAWAYAGTAIGRLLRDARRVRLFNRALAVLLVASAAYLVIG